MGNVRTSPTPQKAEYGVKFEHTLNELHALLKSGRYQPGTKLPAETELFQELKVGRQTLLRAMNVLVKEGLIVRRRGSGTYVAEQESPPLIPGRYLRFGLLWHNSVLRDRLPNSFAGNMTMGALAQWGLHDTSARFPEVSQRETTRAIWSNPRRGVTVEAIGEPKALGHRRPSLAAVREGGYDGLLALSIIDEDWLWRLLELNIPTVIVDNPVEAFAGKADLVFVDSQPGYRHAVASLVASGAKRVHFAGDLISAMPQPEGLAVEALTAWRYANRRQDPDSLLRQHAWQLAMEQEGIPVQPGWIHLSRYGRQEWAPLVEKLADLPECERPDAVVCSSIDTAGHFHDIFSNRGLPLLTAGSALGEYKGPCLPIRLDGKHVGAAAAAMLLNRIQQRNSPFMRVGVAMKFQPLTLSTTPLDVRRGLSCSRNADQLP